MNAKYRTRYFLYSALVSIGFTVAACGGGGSGKGDGSRSWTKVLGTPYPDAPGAIVRDANNALYLVGMTAGTLGEENLGDFDAVLIKFDSAGNKAWVRQFGTTSYESASGVAVDPSGNVIVVGDTGGNLANVQSGSR